MATLLTHIDEFKARLESVKQDGKATVGEILGLASVIAHTAACKLEQLADPSQASAIADEAVEIYSQFVTAENVDIPWVGEKGEAVILSYGEGIIRAYVEKALDWMNGG